MPITVAWPPRRKHFERLFGGDFCADRFERMVHAPVGQVFDCSDGVGVTCVYDVGGSHGLRKFELALDHVDGDDLVRAGDACALDCGESDSAATDHGRRLTRHDLGRAEDRAQTGRDTATDERRAVERHILVDLHEGVLVNEHLLGER